MGPGKVVLAPQLLWWGARGPSVALTTPMNLSGSGHLKTKVPMVRLWHSNVSAPSARKLFFEIKICSVFSRRKCACGALLWIPKPVFVAKNTRRLVSGMSWAARSEGRAACGGCGARPGGDGGGLRSVPPTVAGALKSVMICRDR